MRSARRALSALRRSVLVVLSLAGLGAIGCGRGADEAVLVLVVTASGSPDNVVALEVTLMGAASSSTAHYPRAGADFITFPTTLAARVPARAAGSLTIEVRATDQTGATVAAGHAGPVEVMAGKSQTSSIKLECNGQRCTTAGGLDPDGGVSTPPGPRCGNGRIDLGEACDTAIPPGAPGACPPSDCDDRVPCTTDVHDGDGCNATCVHTEILAPVAGDGCCPARATNATDADCSPACGDGIVDPGETCDTGIPGGGPGACPTIADCADGDPCASDLLASAGTCAAICVHYPVYRQSGATSDGCCPPGGNNAVDIDCPAACGNGIVDMDEVCDVAVLPPAPGSCPAVCSDGHAETTDFVSGSGCMAKCVSRPIRAPVSGDGYCLPGASHSTDSDCQPFCPNKVIEPGEACESEAIGDASCPTSCAPLPSACLLVNLVGTALTCSARCEVTARTSCSLASPDKCCPEGCTALTDADCSPSCGDGVVQTAAGETCDIAIPKGKPGACPTTCADANPCTEERLVSAGTCAAMCVFVPIRAFRPGDGCCPSGADFNVDPDCVPLCGNGVVESPAERCDDASGSGSCPTSCPSSDACTPLVLRGDTATCSAMCVPQPITGCVNGDGCCPARCTSASDDDCPVICGNGVIDTGERCDRGITSGFPGACAYTCDDADACTVDLIRGSVEGCSRDCLHHRVTACLTGDGCCPPGCTPDSDADCAHVCGDGVVGAQETCDPQSTCPTSCPDDGDPCTREQLTGAPSACDVACRHVPIKACSGSAADRCCPNGCTHATDRDC
jgi:hypothetical protein